MNQTRGIKMYYKLLIRETCRSSPKCQPEGFGEVEENFKTMTDLRDFMVEHYGKMPSGKNKIYYDGENGRAEEVGFTYSFWNRDISHNSKPWFQTDWITVYKITSESVLI
jgi:hypothetical protein